MKTFEQQLEDKIADIQELTFNTEIEGIKFETKEVLKLFKEWLTQFIQTYPGGYERSYDSTKRFAVNKFLKDRIKELEG